MLLHAAPTCTPAEAFPGALPSNFVETANLVLSVLNNVAQLDLSAAQQLLSATHSRVEFFHLIGFLLSYCTHQWPGGTSTRMPATAPGRSSAGTQVVSASSLSAAAAAGAGGRRTAPPVEGHADGSKNRSDAASAAAVFAGAGAAAAGAGARRPSPPLESNADELKGGSDAAGAMSAGAGGGCAGRATAAAAAAAGKSESVGGSAPSASVGLGDISGKSSSSSSSSTGGPPKAIGVSLFGAEINAGVQQGSSRGQLGTRATSSSRGATAASTAAAADCGKAKAKALTGSSKNGGSSSVGASTASRPARSSKTAAAAAGEGAQLVKTPVQGGIAAAVAAVAHHPIAELLNQVVVLLGYFCMRNPTNQGMLQWGKSPTLLQRLCSVPFPYFSHPELVDVYMPTLLAVCCNHERACEMVEQYVSMDVLLQYAQSQQQGLQQAGVQKGLKARKQQQGEGAVANSSSSSSTKAGLDGAEPAAAAVVVLGDSAAEEAEGAGAACKVEGAGSRAVGGSENGTAGTSSNSSSISRGDGIAGTIAIWQLGGHLPSALSKLLLKVNNKASCLQAGTRNGVGSSSRNRNGSSGRSGGTMQQQGSGERERGHLPGFPSRFPLQLLPDVVSFLEGYKKSDQQIANGR